MCCRLLAGAGCCRAPQLQSAGGAMAAPLPMPHSAAALAREDGLPMIISEMVPKHRQVSLSASVSSLSAEPSFEQLKAMARLADYPQRVARLKRLWVDVQCGNGVGQGGLAGSRRPQSGGSGRSRSSARLACAGAAAVGAKPPPRYHGSRSSCRSAGRGGGRGNQGPPLQAGPLTAAQIRDLMTREITPEDYDLLLLLDEGVKRARTLTSGAAAALSQAPPCGSWVGDECRICLCALEAGEDVRVLPACGHAYHGPCVERWLSSSRATCPLCGTEVPEVTSPRS
uniref:RING-type domain-containing protein n=1 Tax=Alexandrium monilatum TaxID=311494 RepID=A0A7S4QI70_9DINO